MQDPATHAMTEVALGLSMAFFALLILALLSMQVSVDSAASQQASVDIEHSNKVQLSSSSGARQQAEASPQFGFYYQGSLYNKSLQIIPFNQFEAGSSVIVAVPSDLAFTEVMNIRAKINHPQLFITTLDKQWLQQLEQQS